MKHYQLFNLHFASELEIPWAAKVAEAAPDVTIEYGPVAIPDGINDDPNHLYGRFFDAFRFSIDVGSRIRIEVLKNISEHAIIQVVQGELISALLRQRGLLVLHACCVVGDESAIGFVGGSGWGKSTLAEYFCQNGYELLTDDVLAVDLNGNDARVFAAYPEVRLRSEAAEYLRSDYNMLPQEGENVGRRISNRPTFSSNAAPRLSTLCILEENYRDSTKLSKMKGRELLIEIVRHTRSSNLVRLPALLQEHLRQIERLGQHVTIRRLERKRSLNDLSKILDLVEGLTAS